MKTDSDREGRSDQTVGPGLFTGPEIRVTYTNWRQVTRSRVIRPIQIYYGQTQWYREPQWLLRALDPEDGVVKDFALGQCTFHPDL